MSNEILSIGDFRLPIGVSPKAELIFKSAIGNQKSEMPYYSSLITHRHEE
jgi:hypothetical protein